MSLCKELRVDPKKLGGTFAEDASGVPPLRIGSPDKLPGIFEGMPLWMCGINVP